MDEDGNYVEDPRELIDKRLDFKVCIERAELPENFCRDTYVEYSLLGDNGEFSIFKTQRV
jgi:hypothetical protein